MLYHNSVENMIAALYGRVFFVKDNEGGWCRPPMPVKGAYDSISWFKRRVISTAGHVDKLCVSGFLDRYKGPKLRSYERAAEGLVVMPVLQDADFVIEAFVKDDLVKPGAVPRAIRPMSVRANLALGLYIYPLEKTLYAALDEIARREGCVRASVTKGLNAAEVGNLAHKKWQRFVDPVTVNLDCMRFDQHVSVPSLMWLTDICVAAFGEGTQEGKELRRMLSKQFKTHLVFRGPDGRVSTNVVGTLNSGVMNTSLYGILMMFSIVFTCLKEGDFSRYEILCAGDDTNVMMERADADRFERLIQPHGLKFGFTVKIESVTDVFEKMVFCRTQPVWDGVGYRMVRDPRDSCARDVLTAKDITNKKAYDVLRYSKAQCGLSLATGLPVLQNFYSMLQRGCPSTTKVDRDRSQSGMKFMAARLEPRIRAVSDRSRLSFYDAFGITAWEQVLLEREYDKLEPSFDARCDLSIAEFFPETLIT